MNTQSTQISHETSVQLTELVLDNIHDSSSTDDQAFFSSESQKQVPTTFRLGSPPVETIALEPSPSSFTEGITDLLSPTTTLGHHPVQLTRMELDLSTSRSLSHARRRGQSVSYKYRRGVPSSTASTTPSSNSSSRRLRPGNPSSSSRAAVIEEGGEEQGGGLRASLDAGMASLRRWIRTRGSTPSYTHNASPRRFRQAKDRTCEDDDSDLLGNQAFHPVAVADDSGASESGLTIPGSNGALHPSHLPQPPTISEGEVDEFLRYHQRSPRQRALSEPDAVRIRDLLFQRALSAPQRNDRAAFRRRPPPSASRSGQLLRRSRQQRNQANNTIELAPIASSRLSSPAAEALYVPGRSTLDRNSETLEGGAAPSVEPSTMEGSTSGDVPTMPRSTANNSHFESPNQPDSFQIDPSRQARTRWIIINRRFQVVITVVALVFSLLLFAILVSWVVLTSAYVVSIDKSCDVPLKVYYWLVTLQLIMDVFRSDIMRFLFRWDASTNQPVPCPVIAYNVGYLAYALLVLRMGIQSVFIDDESTCRRTAPELYQSSTAFVSLSIAAWSTIILGYLIPFCVVATLLTVNGYTPSSDLPRDGSSIPFTLFPVSMGAPPTCVDELPIVMLEDFPAHYPMECCICMENFTGTDVIVETGCQHVFHKQCCRHWLRQSRTCPICRTDVPNASMQSAGHHENATNSPRLATSSPPDIRQEMVSLLQFLRRRDTHQQRSETRVALPRSSDSRDGGYRGSSQMGSLEVASGFDEAHSTR